jgi:hypothetical protein
MKRPSRSILWPAFALLLFTASCSHLRAIYLSPPDTSTPTVQVADILTTQSISEPSQASAQYAQITERPLFSRARRPFVPPQPIVEPPPPEPQPIAAELQITLQGIMINSEMRHALILAGGESAPRWFRQGDSIGGWEITGIDSNSIRLAAEGQRRSVNLYVEKLAAPDNLQ